MFLFATVIGCGGDDGDATPADNDGEQDVETGSGLDERGFFGLVTDGVSGAPIAQALVTLVPEAAPYAALSARTDNRGAFVVVEPAVSPGGASTGGASDGVAPSGRFRLYVAAAGYGAEPWLGVPAAEVAMSGQPVRRDMKLFPRGGEIPAGGELRVRVEAVQGPSRGQGLAGALVTAEGFFGARYGYSDAEGYATLLDLPPPASAQHRYFVSALVAGHVVQPKREVVPGEVSGALVLEAVPLAGKTVEVTVESLPGSGAGGALTVRLGHPNLRVPVPGMVASTTLAPGAETTLFYTGTPRADMVPLVDGPGGFEAPPLGEQPMTASFIGADPTQPETARARLKLMPTFSLTPPATTPVSPGPVTQPHRKGTWDIAWSPVVGAARYAVLLYDVERDAVRMGRKADGGLTVVTAETRLTLGTAPAEASGLVPGRHRVIVFALADEATDPQGRNPLAVTATTGALFYFTAIPPAGR